MARYFIEVAYKGTQYAGFQVQKNANTIQAEVENALKVFYRTVFELTGSSRTDAGVHARQNFFHFDADVIKDTDKAVYHLNAILPADIVVKSIRQVADDAHSRFDAVSRSYQYTIYQQKDPFLDDRAYYYPFSVDMEVLQQAAALVKANTNFQSFSKKNTQVFTYECAIFESEWKVQNECLIYNVTGSRFLRGMVRGLVGTMLLTGRRKYSVEKFKSILSNSDTSFTDFSTPAKGLSLIEVRY
jgi:tRNA pseudouridine38-40 synthase